MRLNDYPKRHFERQYHRKLYGWYEDDRVPINNNIGGAVIFFVILLGIVFYALNLFIGIVYTLLVIGRYIYLCSYNKRT